MSKLIYQTFIAKRVPLDCFCSGALYSLRWRHNGRGSVSNHQPHDCLLNRLFRRRSKKTSKLRVPVNSPHKWPVTRKMFPFDDAIMYYSDLTLSQSYQQMTVQLLSTILLDVRRHSCRHIAPVARFRCIFCIHISFVMWFSLLHK